MNKFAGCKSHLSMHPDPPGRVSCSGLTNHSWKIASVTEMPKRNLKVVLILGDDQSAARNRMKLGVLNQFRLETQEPMVISLNRDATNIRIWKSVTMFGIGKTAHAAIETNSKNLSMSGISQSR